ncbi:MAG: SOS response-associated peptidase [Acidimicrobiia bacterium]
MRPRSHGNGLTVCGRFALTGDLDFYRDYYAIADGPSEPLAPSWNLAPTDRAYVVSPDPGGLTLTTMAWGLIPHWSSDTGTIHINARAETIATKPAFRSALARHRCLVPADGFYEWEPKEQGRTAHWIYRADGFPITFAGIWSAWKDPRGGWERNFSIVTTASRGIIAPLHDRMPVMLPDDWWGAWLDPSVDDPQAALSLIRTMDPELLMEHRVSSRVNSVRNNGPELRDPVRETLF